MFQVAQKGDPEVEGLSKLQITERNRSQIEAAVKVCEGCPVRQKCLDESTPGDRFWSVRGGELPGKMTAGRGKNRPPTWDMSGYEESWVCPKHGTLHKREYPRGNGVQVYCDKCRNR